MVSIRTFPRALGKSIFLPGVAIALSALATVCAVTFPDAVFATLAVGIVAAFFFNRTVRAVLFPAVLFFNWTLATHTSRELWIVGGANIWPADWAALFLAAAVALRSALAGRLEWFNTGFEKAITLFLAGMTISLVGAANLKAGIIGIGHFVVFYLAFYAMVADWRDMGAEKLWRNYFFWGMLAILPALAQFFVSGGGRSFGFSGVTLTDLILPIYFFQLVALTVASGKWPWFFAGILILTVIASQTRGAWISLVAVTIAWFVLLSRQKHTLPVGIIREWKGWKVFKLILFAAMLFLIIRPFLGGVEERAEQMVSQTGTVYLRFFLWGLAFKLFLAHPFTGVGLAQFPVIVQQFPEMKNLPVYELTQGLSAHNSFLSLMAETGMAGVAATAFLFLTILRRAWKVAHRARNEREFCFGWGLFLSLFFFAISTFYAGSWIWGVNAYQFMFLLAFLVLYEKQLLERGST